jgi:hypothetical protein
MSRKIAIKDIAYKILSKKNKPLHISELTLLISKETDMSGKTPEKTVNAACQRHEKIVRVGKGLFKSQ